MAYGAKYQFIFESQNGAEVKIEVLKDGYSGTVTQRPLGAAPVLRQQRNDRVAGSSLAFTPECHVDGEFSEFYTTDPKEFRVDLYRENTKIWSGFITPELYSEPDIAPPYDVSVTATDGLGELRRSDFLPLGKVTLHALFSNLLSFTGQSLSVNYISRLAYTGVSYNAFFIDTYIDLDYKAGESCYDVLQYLLTTFNASICFFNGAWLIVRENDITVGGSGPDYITASGTASAFADGLMTIGSMGTPGVLWPVDFTSTSVDPALRRMTVEAPWNLVSGLLNSGMTADASWTKGGSASYNSVLQGYSLLPQAYVSQSITQLMGKPFLLTFYAAAYVYRPNNAQKYSQAVVEVTFVSGADTYYLAEDENGGIYWSDTASDIRYRIESGSDRATAAENQLDVPAVTDDNGDALSGTLTIKISADTVQGLRLFGAYLTTAAEKGYKDSLEIDNGARGDASDVSIAIGYETSGLDDYKSFYAGILLDGNDDLVTSLSTQNFSGLDFLSLISRDFARSIALPRLRTTGTLNTPVSFVKRPLLVTHRSTVRWVETFDWNLYTDDFDFDAVSIPTGSITVDTETIVATGSAAGAAANTIGRLTPGSGDEGLTIMLSNTAHVFNAKSDGYAYLASDGVRVIAFRGGSAVATTVGTITGHVTDLTTSINDNSTTSTTVVVRCGTGCNQSGTLVIPVTADGVTVNLQYNWALAPEGDDGTDGYNTATVQIFQRAASSPALPPGTFTYTFSTGTLSGTLGSWSVTPPAADGNTLWMASAKAISRTNTASITSWNGPVKYIEDGLPGARGKTPRGPTEWAANMAYEGVDGTGDFVDYVFAPGDTSVMYYCKTDHTSANISELSDTSKWGSTPVTDFVATKVLYSTLGYVQNLGVNILKVQTGGVVTGGMMPPSTDGNGNTIFWAGSSSPGTAPFTIDKDGNMTATSGTFSGRLVLPFVDMSSNKTLGTTSDSTHINASSIRILTNYGSSASPYTLTLPNSSDFNGWWLNVYIMPRVSQLDVAGSIAGSILVPEKASSSTFQYLASTIYAPCGGYFNLVCVSGQWVLTSYNAASVVFNT